MSAWMCKDGDCRIVGRKDYVRTEMWRFLRTTLSKQILGRGTAERPDCRTTISGRPVQPPASRCPAPPRRRDARVRLR
jgi:hypothetical protein